LKASIEPLCTKVYVNESGGALFDTGATYRMSWV
jgi:hypothetical protein